MIKNHDSNVELAFISWVMWLIKAHVICSIHTETADRRDNDDVCACGKGVFLHNCCDITEGFPHPPGATEGGEVYQSRYALHRADKGRRMGEVKWVERSRGRASGRDEMGGLAQGGGRIGGSGAHLSCSPFCV